MATKRADIVTTKEDALAALRALAATGAYDTAYHLRYVEITGIIPDWLNAYKPGAWFVRHAGRVSETTAVSERDAINKVRFRCYGMEREDDCPAFEAVCPYDVVLAAVNASRGIVNTEIRKSADLFGRNTISKADAIARLKNMRKAS